MSANNSTIPLSKLTCASVLQANGSNVPPLQANADIAGIGVILSYFMTAYFTLLMALLGYVFGLIPKEMINAADRHFYRVKSSQSPEWHKAMEKGVCAFSDQQIITGIAILIAGFSQLHSIDVYHWQLLVYLGWMSSNTHLTTLTMLRDYFRNRPFITSLRLSGMVILLILLFTAFAPTANAAWTSAIIPGLRGGISSPGAPARCFFEHSFYRGVSTDAPFAYLLLIVTFLWKGASLYLGNKLSKTLKKIPLNWLGRTLINQTRRHHAAESSSLMVNFRYRITLATYIGLVAISDFLQSFAASLWALTILLAWGTIVFTGTRNGGSSWMQSEENTWAYGQILPLLLLALPLASIWEHFYKDKSLKVKSTPQFAPIETDNDTEASTTSQTVVTFDKEKGASEHRVREHTEEVNQLLDAHDHPYEPVDGKEAQSAPSISDYIAQMHPFNTIHHEVLDHDLIAERYLYRSVFFLSLFLCINIMLVVGSCLIFVTEGLLIFQVGSTGNIAWDFRGILWLPVAGLAAAGCVWWIVWFGVGMWFSKLFKLRPKKGD